MKFIIARPRVTQVIEMMLEKYWCFTCRLASCSQMMMTSLNNLALHQLAVSPKSFCVYDDERALLLIRAAIKTLLNLCGSMVSGQSRWACRVVTFPYLMKRLIGHYAVLCHISIAYTYFYIAILSLFLTHQSQLLNASFISMLTA